MVYWEVKYPFPMSNRDVSFPGCTVARLSQRRCAPWPSPDAGVASRCGQHCLILAEASAKPAASCAASGDLRVGSRAGPRAQPIPGVPGGQLRLS